MNTGREAEALNETTDWLRNSNIPSRDTGLGFAFLGHQDFAAQMLDDAMSFGLREPDAVPSEWAVALSPFGIFVDCYCIPRFLCFILLEYYE